MTIDLDRSFLWARWLGRIIQRCASPAVSIILIPGATSVEESDVRGGVAAEVTNVKVGHLPDVGRASA
ncbi:MAG: hypothetical protein O6834_09990 [Actinobacteria bacterium]|nr:hypothetical protein [Actinomycetota bacterium]MCZ6738628.1 hypothetical protein [Actinomycetota bacterium]